ncbi:MAG: hypothetical protein H7338_16990 [Candidatus Sericytochromatia bacterium]|nr:hypothetical protein [Candidatus Sericytochromatia bacterium]
MRLLIDGQAATVTQRDEIGCGGEATVYRWRDQAVKVYHPVAAKADQAVLMAFQHKLTKIRQFPRRLPQEVIAPTALALDYKTGQVLGYTMPLIVDSHDIRKLGQRSWREGVIGNDAVMRFFGRLHAALTKLHQRGVVVGDLNDGNVLFTGEQPWLIDADSMQFGAYGCPVAHESFLDPRLYSVDLMAGPVFTPDTDWYAFAVHLFRSLLYVHPYGGVHTAHKTMLRRAEVGHSVMRPDVIYPKAAVSWRILPEELIDWFAGIFDHNRREAFPIHLLDIAWTTCPCGTTHARSVCPDCAVRIPQTARPATAMIGKCQATTIFQTSGRILAACLQNGLKYLYAEGDTVRRETGSAVLTQARQPGLRFAISGTATWMGVREQLVQVQHEAVLNRTTSSTFAGETVFDANATSCYRFAGDWLVDSLGGNRIGQALDGQTWFRMGDRFGFGFYRTGRMTVYFVFDPKQPGLRQVELPPIEGRLVDVQATFDRGRVLVSLACDRDGQRQHSMAVVQADGTVLAHIAGSPESQRCLATLGGKALLGDCILVPTDNGLLALALNPITGTMTEGNLFVDTEPFVTEDAQLFPGPGGSVYVVTAQTIMQLTLI